MKIESAATGKVSIADALKYVQSLGVKVKPKPLMAKNGVICFALNQNQKDAVESAKAVIGQPYIHSPSLTNWHLGREKFVLISDGQEGGTPYPPYICLSDYEVKNIAGDNNVTAGYESAATGKVSIADALKYVQSLGVKVKPKPLEAMNGVIRFALGQDMKEAVSAAKAVLGPPNRSSSGVAEWELNRERHVAIYAEGKSRGGGFSPHVVLTDSGVTKYLGKNNVTAGYVESSKLRSRLETAARTAGHTE